jgi:DNA-binding MarR family transcriptional regulator
MAHGAKKQLVEQLITEFRISGNQDNAIDHLAGERLGVNPTDLRCLNIIENTRGLGAGELAAQSGLTAGAVTGVIDRLERAGFARRVSDPDDRRRVRIEVTPAFYRRTEEIWAPIAAEWHSTLAKRFTIEELERIVDFLHATNALGRRHLDRLRTMLDD